jgi:hypothetical protein
MFAPNGYDPTKSEAQLYKAYFGAYALPIGSQMMRTHDDFDAGTLDGEIYQTLAAVIRRRTSASYTCGCPDPTGQDRYKDTAANAQTAHLYLVKLCDKFWTLPLTGRTSRASTLLHELTHFKDSVGFNDGRAAYIVPGTADLSYYSPGAKNLALKSRSLAAMNADNYLNYAVDAAVATQFPGY